MMFRRRRYFTTLFSAQWVTSRVFLMIAAVAFILPIAAFFRLTRQISVKHQTNANAKPSALPPKIRRKLTLGTQRDWPMAA
jgi:hypothetical protein